MANVGDWVDYQINNRKSKKAFLILVLGNYSTIQVVGEPFGKSVLHVPNYCLTSCANPILPQDKEMLVDMALAINDKEWFQSLTGSLSAI